MDIFTILQGIFLEAWRLFYKMSPYLLFGYLFAGILHVVIKTETISHHLGKNNILSVIKASLLGVPLPLCSCSVIPAAMSLKKDGASRGSVLSFLISTPTTGVDSILATYSLMGWLFTIYRILASFITGVIAGISANFLLKDMSDSAPAGGQKCKFCSEGQAHAHGPIRKVKECIRYAFSDLIADSGLALLAGILIGGIITFFIPDDMISRYMGSTMLSMLIMLLAGIPMYVCATASIPIAASLLAKGMNPGAALVFLIAGPATNTVTMSVIKKDMGTKALILYLFSIIVGSMTLGAGLNPVYRMIYGDTNLRGLVHHHELIPPAVSFACSALLLFLIAISLLKRVKAIMSRRGV